MAQAKKSTAAKKKTTNSRGNSRGNTRSNSRGNSSVKKTAPKQQEPVEVGFGDYWHAFTKTRVFVPIMVIVVTAILVGLDLLIAWNDYHRFFLFLGIELIIAAVVWLFRMIFSIGSDKNSDDRNEA